MIGKKNRRSYSLTARHMKAQRHRYRWQRSKDIVDEIVEVCLKEEKNIVLK